MIVLKMCSVLTTVMFLSWAWFGAPETWTDSALPDMVSSSHFMLKSLMAFFMFLATMVAKGLLLPAEDSSLGRGEREEREREEREREETEERGEGGERRGRRERSIRKGKIKIS